MVDWGRGGNYEIVAPAGNVIKFTGSNVTSVPVEPLRARLEWLTSVVSCQGRAQHGIGIANGAHLLLTQERDLDWLVWR